MSGQTVGGLTVFCVEHNTYTVLQAKFIIQITPPQLSAHYNGIHTTSVCDNSTKKRHNILSHRKTAHTQLTRLTVWFQTPNGQTMSPLINFFPEL